MNYHYLRSLAVFSHPEATDDALITACREHVAHLLKHPEDGYSLSMADIDPARLDVRLCEVDVPEWTLTRNTFLGDAFIFTLLDHDRFPLHGGTADGAIVDAVTGHPTTAIVLSLSRGVESEARITASFYILNTGARWSLRRTSDGSEKGRSDPRRTTLMDDAFYNSVFATQDEVLALGAILRAVTAVDGEEQDLRNITLAALRRVGERRGWVPMPVSAESIRPQSIVRYTRPRPRRGHLNIYSMPVDETCESYDTRVRDALDRIAQESGEHLTNLVAEAFLTSDTGPTTFTPEWRFTVPYLAAATDKAPESE